MSDQPVSTRPVWERHIQTVMMTLVIGGLGWVGSTILEVSEQQAVQTVRIEHLVRQVEEFKISIKDRYTRTDALRDWNRYEREMAEVKDRVTRIEERFERN